MSIMACGIDSLMHVLDSIVGMHKVDRDCASINTGQWAHRLTHVFNESCRLPRRFFDRVRPGRSV